MEYKNLKKVKGTLMDGILNAMDKINEDEDDFASRVRSEQKRLLEEVNGQFSLPLVLLFSL